MKDLFKAHIEKRMSQIHHIMDELNIDSLIIDNGFPDYYYLDDQPTYFKSNPHFNFLCPDEGSGHMIKISKKQTKT